MATHKMIDYNQMSDADFRLMIKEWLVDNYPKELRYPPGQVSVKDSWEWYQLLSKKGWLAPGWPQEYGGMGLDGGKQISMMEEFELYGCTRIPNLGLGLLAPLLINFGTQEQKDYYLPKMLSGEHIWAQGYSEPNAGSDLAHLTTEAVLDGNEWVINGQKTWATIGTEANWMFLLVRTDKTVKPQAGISFLLVPLNTPGVEVRPIKMLDRYGTLADTFFTNARVPVGNLVGEINQGWTMAKALLGFERLQVGSPQTAANALERLEILAKYIGIWGDKQFQLQFSQLNMDIDCHNALYKVYADQVRRGEPLGADVSMLKIHQSELFVLINEVNLKIIGESAGVSEPFIEGQNWSPSDQFLQSLKTTIYSGSNEIQRNIISKHVLKLPD